jgi:hypothetical protein
MLLAQRKAVALGPLNAFLAAATDIDGRGVEMDLLPG